MRFVVSTCSGYRSTEASGRTRPGLSAHVLDGAYNFALVASFRSEDNVATKDARGRFFVRTRRLGVEGALERARERARALNETEAE